MSNAETTPPPQIVIQQKESLFGRFGKLLLIGLVVCIMLLFGMAASVQQYYSEPGGPQERYHSLDKVATSKIAIIRAEGTIMEGDDFIKKQIERVEEDEDVVAVVLRVSSPGGTVTWSDYLYHQLVELRKERELPIVVSMGSICASGGYYISMAVGEQEDAIFAEPTTWTGSIGVIIPHYDFSGLMGTLSIRDDSIASGPLKQMGSPTQRMTEEEREIFQELVDETFKDFKTIVKAGRPVYRDDEESLDAVATGQIFTAKQALDKGLVDRIGFMEEAIERAAEIAGVSTDEVRCVEYKKPQGPLDALFEAQTPATPPDAHQQLLKGLTALSTPRAYYLMAPLPTLLNEAAR